MVQVLISIVIERNTRGAKVSVGAEDYKEKHGAAPALTLGEVNATRSVGRIWRRWRLANAPRASEEPLVRTYP